MYNTVNIFKTALNQGACTVFDPLELSITAYLIWCKPLISYSFCDWDDIYCTRVLLMLITVSRSGEYYLTSQIRWLMSKLWGADCIHWNRASIIWSAPQADRLGLLWPTYMNATWLCMWYFMNGSFCSFHKIASCHMECNEIPKQSSAPQLFFFWCILDQYLTYRFQ